MIWPLTVSTADTKATDEALREASFQRNWSDQKHLKKQITAEVIADSHTRLSSLQKLHIPHQWRGLTTMLIGHSLLVINSNL